MAKLKSYRELEVWKRAMDLVESVYKLTEKLPSQEKFGLSSQIRRAAVSIPANIAEGYGQSYLKGYIHHLHISSGSLAELETYLCILQRLSYIDGETIELNRAKLGNLPGNRQNAPSINLSIRKETKIKVWGKGT